MAYKLMGINGKEWAGGFSMMDRFTRVNGPTTNRMGGGESFWMTVNSTKDTSKMDGAREWASAHIQMAESNRAIGS